MEQQNVTPPLRKGKHLNRDERIQIEGLLKAKRPPSEIASLLGRNVRTIQREIRRGEVKHLKTDLTHSQVYNADRSQDVHDLNATAKGPPLKLGSNGTLVEFIRLQIVEHKDSPAVVAHRMKSENLGCTLCTKTIYSYIDQGLIQGVTQEALWEKRKRRKRGRKTLRRKAKKSAPPGHGIQDRPPKVADREEFGHWEIDLIVSRRGGGGALLTLVERKTRRMILRKLADKTQLCVLNALAEIERSMGSEAFREVFKTITADNGSEFLDVLGLERSNEGTGNRTRWYYAHPFASWERGSNENGNRMIRRFIPKGSDLATISKKTIQQTEDWLNRYPRKILGFQTAEERYLAEVAA